MSASAGPVLISTDISAEMNAWKRVVCLIFLPDTAQITGKALVKYSQDTSEAKQGTVLALRCVL